jgi:signal transduction histidine kinase
VKVQTRLLLVSLLTLAIALGALLVVGNVLLASGVRSQASSVLRARADAQVASLSVTPTGIRVRESKNEEVLDRTSWVLDGDRVIERPAGIAPAVDRAAAAFGRARLEGERDGPSDIRLRAVPLRARPGAQAAGAVVVGYSVESLEHVQHLVLLGSLVLAALILAGGGVAVHRALEGALRPVAQMTAHAEDWSAHDLDRRFALGPPRDELTGLAATLDGLLARIAASRRHEQRFASEVAHELRTPIAAMRARAELALRARNAAAKDEALQDVVDDTARLDRAIDALLAVARRELDPSVGSVDLAALARQVEGAEVVVRGALRPAAGDVDVVRRALAPLLENARRHGRGHVVLELSGDDRLVRLAVRDDGPGLDPALGERAFEPGVRGAGENGDGVGLGLPLARRLARSCGGDIVAGPGPGGCFVLELPAVGREPIR